MESALYIVPTPIGNKDDITKRAIDVLTNATLIAAEDTRHTKGLLDMLSIPAKKMISCNDHNEEERATLIIDEIKKGGIVALASDAGTPLISDPGYRVVSICAKHNVKVIPLPGACAAITALEGSGLPTDRFLFRGFLPVKNKDLIKVFEDVKESNITTVFYESPRRIIDTLEVIKTVMPENPICLARELTKCFETFYRGKAFEILDTIKSHDNHTKGEFVLIIGPIIHMTDTKDELSKDVLECIDSLKDFVPSKVLSTSLAKLCNLNKKDLYNYIASNKS